MSILEYEVEPEETWQPLWKLADGHPRKVRRWLDALEDFVRAETDGSDRIYPVGGGDIEVYIVPGRAQWIDHSGLAVLVLVDHRKRKIGFVACFEEYDSVRPGEQRVALERLAEVAVNKRRAN